MGFINVEIKALCSDPEKVERILMSNGAEFKGEDHQIDTYFNTPNGRLKLREGNIENALIFYKRNNQQGPKISDVVLYKSTPGSSLKQILTETAGIRVVVDKRRRIFFIDNVKFHIDNVLNLGHFIEIEAIDQQGLGNQAPLEKQCKQYMNLLEVQADDLVSESYSDMLNK